MSEIVSTIDKIVDVVQGNKAKEKSGNGGLIAGIVTAVLALLALAVMAYQAWRAGKERAKLLHEKALAEEAKHQAEVDAKLAEKQEEKDEALREVAELGKELDRLEEEVQTLEEKREKAKAIIDKISDWDDIDRYIQ